ncbi:hypothetical protein PGT21_010556 [Puccinia graminis f. sp. tritici]|uniref:Uncharacterized protein n=1 Tax=Puccinia graminis f. sp. tritici TaxID=56615 RepID=A0A5B0RG75_PUCGR|nr:hypothetical protein PGT21_010556 [Puccinia graminis f. sp. tritici]KAA1124856.1 hypothetical protein PGTUg99_036028 [Puccinia graminis f. sp. tritici]
MGRPPPRCVAEQRLGGVFTLHGSHGVPGYAEVAPGSPGCVCEGISDYEKSTKTQLTRADLQETFTSSPNTFSDLSSLVT